MASSKEYLIFILEQLSGLDDITYRAMRVNTSFIIVRELSVEYTMIGFL